MKKFVVLLYLIGFVFLPAYANDKEVISDYYDMAQDFYELGYHAQALEYANQILKINPNHYGARYMIIKLTPSASHLAETNLSTQIVLKPENTNTAYPISDKYNKQGEELYAKKSYEEAKNCFKKAIKYNRKNRYAYNNLGLAYWKLHNTLKAEYCFKKANKFNPTFTIPLDNLAQMYIENGNNKKAEKTLLFAIQRNKNDYCSAYLLGSLYKLQNKYSEAIKYFNLSSQICPKFALAHLQLADTYYLTKDYNWSNSSIENYTNLYPKDDYAYYLLYRNYLALEDYNVAKNYIVKAIHINNCIEYRVALANIDDKLNNTMSAIETLKMIKNPEPEIQNQIGQYYLKQKDENNAIKYFLLAAAGKNSRPIYLYNAAIAYKNINKLEDYKKLIEKIESIDPMSTQDYIDLSAIFLDYSGKNKSLAILDRGIKLSPNNQALYDAKIKIYTLTSDKKGIDCTKKQMKKVIKNG